MYIYVLNPPPDRKREYERDGTHFKTFSFSVQSMWKSENKNMMDSRIQT